jgi:hypothetical protein
VAIDFAATANQRIGIGGDQPRPVASRAVKLFNEDPTPEAMI